MYALIIIANPGTTSFSHAMAEVVSTTLMRQGIGIARHDLYEEAFNPVQPTGEAGNTTSPDPLVESHCRDVRRADLIFIFHPNWWSQPPAILKGWVDRVLRLGTAYGYPDGAGFDGVPIGLLKAKCAFVFNTSNTPLEREREVFGDPLDTLWRRSVFSLCGVDHVVRRMFGPMSSSSADQRELWLNEVASLTEDAVRANRSADAPPNAGSSL